ncbi:hypothetical protein C8Q74DRAFT_1233273 [Fomes fomentarius]|nr:hypothetical protein C8Q74DRAFT_1233273 [Fomes fomentarius]
MFPIGLDPSCSGTEAFYVLVLDSTGSARQLVTTLISTVLFGLATGLALATTSILLRVGRRPFKLLCATTILYLSNVVFWAAAIKRNLTYAGEASAAALALSRCDAHALFNPIRTAEVGDRMSCVQTASLTISIVVGDAVVWWRAVVLWNGRSKSFVLSLCTVLLLGTFAISTADTCGACNFELDRSDPGFGQLFTGTRVGAAAAILSLVSNLVATSLTGYKAWAHGRMLRKYFAGGTAMTNVERILILLTESGLTYGIIWIFVVAFQIRVSRGTLFDNLNDGNSFWSVVQYVVDGGLVPVITIYPMAIIVLVALQKSQMEKTLSTHEPTSSLELSSHIPTSVSLTRPSLAERMRAQARNSALANHPGSSSSTVGQHSEDDTQLGVKELESVIKMEA